LTLLKNVTLSSASQCSPEKDSRVSLMTIHALSEIKSASFEARSHQE